MNETDFTRCDRGVIVGEVSAQCVLATGHRGLHQADVKAMVIFGADRDDALGTDGTATVSW